jgi:hypothetical protein
MILYNNYKSRKERAQELGERAGNEPALIPEIQENGEASNAYYEEYKAKCI